MKTVERKNMTEPTEQDIADAGRVANALGCFGLGDRVLVQLHPGKTRTVRCPATVTCVTEHGVVIARLDKPFGRGKSAIRAAGFRLHDVRPMEAE